MYSFFKQSIYTYSWSQDPTELNAYFYLRQQRYQAVHHENIEIDNYDKPGHILLAKRGNKVVGGIRLTIFNVDTPLPLEKYGFDYKQWMPEIAKLPHCELSRLCVAVDETKTEVSQQLVMQALVAATSKGCRYMLATSTTMYLEHYQNLFASIGYRFISTPYKKEVQLGDKPMQLCFARVDLQDRLLANSFAQADNVAPDFIIRAKM